MRTQLVAQLRDLVSQRFNQLFDSGSIRHGVSRESVAVYLPAFGSLGPGLLLV
jgi:hypothetical protein